MGKLFGFGKSGSISLRLNKPSYVAGELVTGTIFVTIHEAIQCDALVLKATGKEKVSWYQCHHEDGEKRRDHHDKSHEFFKQKIVISAIPSTYLPGSYTYPFEYLLPPGLPGVCELNNFHSANVEDLNATIRYKFKATLDVQGMFSKDLKDSVRLVVHEQLRQDIRPSEDSTTQTVRYLCCLNKGTCSLGVAMDKNVYFPGEVAQINVVVNNASSVDFTRMRCTLNQLVTLKVYGRTHMEREVAKQAFPGVNAGLSITQSQPLALVPNLNNVSHINPSTNGAIIQCAYRLDIECDIPMCPDVELHMPITIIAPVLPDPQYVVPGTSYVPPILS